MRILLVEDDRDIVRFLKKGLLENGYGVDVHFDGEAGLHSVLQRQYDLVLLDIMLPRMDGREILERMREKGIHTPVIFLTAKDSEGDIVHGLNLGADDYLVKPFSFNELLARVHAILRRGEGAGSASKLQAADLVLELDGHRVFRENRRIELTP